MTVADALALYYVNAGLPTDGGAQVKWFRVQVGPLAIPLPNPPARLLLVGNQCPHLHDLKRAAGHA